MYAYSLDPSQHKLKVIVGSSGLTVLLGFKAYNSVPCLHIHLKLAIVGEAVASLKYSVPMGIKKLKSFHPGIRIKPNHDFADLIQWLNPNLMQGPICLHSRCLAIR